jgi:hypothetical protein
MHDYSLISLRAPEAHQKDLGRDSDRNHPQRKVPTEHRYTTPVHKPVKR